MICMLSRDLMSASSVRAAIQNEHTEFHLVQSLDQMQSLWKQDQFHTLILDLQTPGLEFEKISALVGDATEPVHTIAFAQHVLPELLKEARAHFDTVLTRGQFLRSPQDWIANRDASS